jgi:hypothetical protein
VSGQAPCSGAKRRGKELDEVSSAILGDAVAENVAFQRARAFCAPLQKHGYMIFLFNFETQNRF